MADIYESITNRIIELLEKANENDANPFANFTNTGKYNYKTKRQYSLLNSLLLPKQGGYITFKQALEMGGKPKKGSKTHPIYFFTFVKRTKEDGTEEEFPILKYFNVFHTDDIEGVDFNETHYDSSIPEDVNDIEDTITKYLDMSGVDLQYDEDHNIAVYNKVDDRITISTPDRFKSFESYYHTLFHEISHSTGTLERLHRKEIVNGCQFGDCDYSTEELTAELSSCMILSHFKINQCANFKMSAGYIKSWIQALKNDKRMIVHASSRAEKACRYILTGEEPQY